MKNVAIIKSASFMANLVDGLLSEGDTSQAKEVITGAIQSLDPNETDELIGHRNLLCKVLRAEGDYAEALKVHASTFPLIQLSDSHTLKAKFHNGLGATYEKLQEYDRAFIEYEASRYHLEEVGDRDGAGYVENNVAVLLCALGRTVEAREHLAKARTYFTDPVRLAEIDESEAQVCLKENNPMEALRLILSAGQMFIEHGETRLLNESIRTLIKAAVDYQSEGWREPGVMVMGEDKGE